MGYDCWFVGCVPGRAIIMNQLHFLGSCKQRKQALNDRLHFLRWPKICTNSAKNYDILLLKRFCISNYFPTKKK